MHQKTVELLSFIDDKLSQDFLTCDQSSTFANLTKLQIGFNKKRNYLVGFFSKSIETIHLIYGIHFLLFYMRTPENLYNNIIFSDTDLMISLKRTFPFWMQKVCCYFATSFQLLPSCFNCFNFFVELCRVIYVTRYSGNWKEKN